MESPAATQLQAYGFVPMDFCTVPQQDDLAVEVLEQQTEKRDHPRPVDVVAVALKVRPIHWRAGETVIAEMTETRSCR